VLANLPSQSSGSDCRHGFLHCANDYVRHAYSPRTAGIWVSGEVLANYGLRESQDAHF
jgi:hypothetical protein